MSGTFQREYIYFNGIAMARRDSNPGSPYYRFTDHLGSLRVLTEFDGDIVQELDYDPFGAEIAVISNPQIDDQYRFISRERDAESGLDYAIFRYDSSRLGRFLTPDPIAGSLADPQSLDRYAYVVNDPVNRVDPLGLSCSWIVDWQQVTWSSSGPGPITITGVQFLGCSGDALFALIGKVPRPILYPLDPPGEAPEVDPAPGGGGGGMTPQNDPTCSVDYCHQKAKSKENRCLIGPLVLTGVVAGVFGVAVGVVSSTYLTPFGGVVAGIAAGVIVGAPLVEASMWSCKSVYIDEFSNCEADRNRRCGGAR